MTTKTETDKKKTYIVELSEKELLQCRMALSATADQWVTQFSEDGDQTSLRIADNYHDLWEKFYRVTHEQGVVKTPTGELMCDGGSREFYFRPVSYSKKETPLKDREYCIPWTNSPIGTAREIIEHVGKLTEFEGEIIVNIKTLEGKKYRLLIKNKKVAQDTAEWIEQQFLAV